MAVTERAPLTGIAYGTQPAVGDAAQLRSAQSFWDTCHDCYLPVTDDYDPADRTRLIGIPGRVR